MWAEDIHRNNFYGMGNYYFSQRNQDMFVNEK